MELELTREYLDRLVVAIEAQDTNFVQQSMEDVHPADINVVLEELNTAQAKFVIDVLPKEVSAEIIAKLDSDTRTQFIKVFESGEIASLIPLMDSDDAADMLEEQPVRFREEIIAQIADFDIANDLIELLHYPEDCAGGLMAKELIKVNQSWTVIQTIEEIRAQAENVDKIFSVYVVDDQDRLMGKVSIKKILLSRSNTRIQDIYDDEIVSVLTFDDVREVAETMRKYDLEAIPVVNIAGKLLGRITVDDVLDTITEIAEFEQQLMSGISSSVDADSTIWESARARLPWLLIGMGGGLTGAKFMGIFEADLQLIPAMAFFVPLITATGGNVGIQSSTVVVQLLANQSSMMDMNWLGQMGKTMIVAVFNAVVLCLLSSLFFLAFHMPTYLAIIVLPALFSVVCLASFTGTLIPLIMNRFGVNPALASGPFITTANDLMGLAVYFGVAHWVHNLNLITR